MSCALIIPARAGSKGIPRKNIRGLAGIPLIAHIIRAAQESNAVDEIYVSTDGDDIAKTAEEHGAQAIERPKDIAGDFAASEDAILHALDALEGRGVLPEYTFFAQCTAPLTKASDLDGAMALMHSNDCDSIFAAKQFHGFIWRRDENDVLYGVNHDHTGRRPMRQELPPEYQETGAFYLFRTHGFRQAKQRFFGRIGVYEIPEERSIDIDSLEDFARAEKFINEHTA